MRIVVFGTGRVYQENKHELYGKVEVVACLDNNSSLWGSCVDGVQVYNPDDVVNMQYDAIVLMSVYAAKMREQLRRLGVQESKIYYLRRFIGHVNKGKINYYGIVENAYPRVAIITTDLEYSGAALAAIHMADAFKDNQYNVTVMAPNIEHSFLEDMLQKGYQFVQYRNLQYADYEEIEFIKDYDLIVVNTFPMIKIAVMLSKYKRVILWMHESEGLFVNIKDEFEEIEETDFGNIDIYAVSGRSRAIFNQYFSGVPVKLLPLGISDADIANETEKKEKKVIFAIIGAIYPLKSQGVFVQAIKKIREIQKQKAEFWIVGDTVDAAYFKTVQEAIGEDNSVKLLGVKNREEMLQIYQQLDVVVCASLEECLPSVIIEGMMHGKICITTETTGVADYIIDGKNGFICPTQDVDFLHNRLSFVIDNIEQLDDMRIAARNTYVENFSVEAFRERIKNIIG